MLLRCSKVKRKGRKGRKCKYGKVTRGPRKGQCRKAKKRKS